MNNVDNRSCLEYWQNACGLFRVSEASACEGSYFFHNKSLGFVKIGINSRAIFSDLSKSELLGKEATFDRFSTENKLRLQQISSLIDNNSPFFFVISPDIYREFADETLPSIYITQPDIEFTFSSENPLGEVSYARSVADHEEGLFILQKRGGAAPADVTNREPPPFSDMASKWIATETDENFLERLEGAISTLQDFPAGKMTLTRGYEYRIPPGLEPFALYELQAHQNGEYASSHFLCIAGKCFSLGCSPENKFEKRGDKLVVDIVAATCKMNGSEDYIARELINDPKQIKEHRFSIESRPKRFSAFCLPNSMHLIKEMDVKRLRNVCHLHSVAQGELLPGVTFLDLLESVPFPLLGSSPKELNLVADTEKEPHRYYGGLIGHFDESASGCFLNIRNAMIKGDRLYAKVGVGLVAESVAERELWETQDKISGLMEAVQLWNL